MKDIRFQYSLRAILLVACVVGIGVGLWLFCSLILCLWAGRTGMVALIGFSSPRVLRLVRQWYAGYRWRTGVRVRQASEEGPSCVSPNG